MRAQLALWILPSEGKSSLFPGGAAVDAARHAIILEFLPALRVRLRHADGLGFGAVDGPSAQQEC